MVVLSDCLQDVVDEGCLKVANSLVKRIKEKYPETFIISYKHQSSMADCFLDLNPLFANKKLWTILRERKEEVLYIPFASNTLMSAWRLLVLSIVNGGKVKTIFTLRHSMNPLARFLLRLSGAKIFVLSKESADYFSGISSKTVVHLKAGCDASKFCPVDIAKKAELRTQYGIDPQDFVVFHAGHLNKGRNIGQLLKIDQKYHVVLLLSTKTSYDADVALLNEIKARPNTTVIWRYIPKVEELYQLSDVYFFPVVEAEHCIDLPLSVLEAASCNISVVCTRYGALKELEKEEGLLFLEDFDSEYLNNMISNAIHSETCCTREIALSYDWNSAVETILNP